MRPRILALIVITVLSLLMFAYVLRQVSLVSVGLAANAEMRRMLAASLDDQKKLARLDPDEERRYRQRFEDIRTLLARSEILALTRGELTRRIEIVLLTLLAAMLLSGGTIYLLEQRSRERRLSRLGAAIEALSRGEPDITLGEKRRDLIGRIAGMIEETSRVMTGHRRRVQYLEHLSSWQEAARRHAHEIRTPLTAAQMELARLVSMVAKRIPEASAEVRQAEASILEELEELRKFTSTFASFARVGQPQPRPHDIGKVLSEFCSTFAPTWPHLNLQYSNGGGEHVVPIDREMVRQVLVNLCTNSALAIGERGGNVHMLVRKNASNVTVEVSDDGPGVAPEVRTRLFEPYTTTRPIGEGMGLGLAISKKIMLDHGGDLEFVDAGVGATFRLVFPTGEAHAG